MRCSPCLRWTLLVCLLVIGSFCPTAAVQGQPKAAPPAIPATYPTLTTPWNLGAKPGEQVELLLTGTNLLDATGVWTSFNGEVTIPEGQKDATKLKVQVKVPKDVSFGLQFLRVATKKGISNVRPLTIDPFPVQASNGENKAKTKPQMVPVPCVVTGAASNEAAEYFKFPVQAGKPITLEVLARRLGSPLDPVIILYDASGKELGGYYADDTPGLMSDCRAVYTPKQSGEMIVEVRDTTYRGGADFTYRLRIGQYPGAMTANPLNIQRGKEAKIGFSGPKLEAVPAVSVKAPSDPLTSVVYVSPKDSSGNLGWPVPVRISDHPELTEQEPNNDIKSATTIPVPGGVTGQFLTKNDLDFYKFTGKKGTKYQVVAETFERSSPTEVLVKIQDAKGAELSRTNPQNVPTRLEFTAPADGEFFIVCEHTNYLFGPGEIYHLSVTPMSPIFTLTLGLDRLDVSSGSVGLLPITGFGKLNGWNSPVEVTVVGEDVTGSFTIPASANPQVATPFLVPFLVKPGAKPGPRIVKVKATGQADGQTITRLASTFDPVRASLNGIAIPPEELVTQLAIAVTPEAPFSIAVTPEKVSLAPGGTSKGKLTAKRVGKADEEIVFSVLNPIPNVNVKLVPIAKGKADCEFELSATPQATPGVNQLILKATSKIGGQDVTVILTPLSLTITEAKKKDEPKKKEEPKKK
jgi:hypothetical protein